MLELFEKVDAILAPATPCTAPAIGQKTFTLDGNTVFPIYGASGGLAASYIFYFDTAFQVWDDSPRTGAFIDTLARPSGY